VAFDSNSAVAEKFAEEIRASRDYEVDLAANVVDATRASEIVVTTTPSRRALLDIGDVKPGTFIAAVGADNEHKQEISPALLRSAAVVVDDLAQCSEIGDLHHALELGVMQQRDVRASLDQIVAGRIRGRLDDEEIIIFDSTGVAIEDVAAAALVYERAEISDTGKVGRESVRR
jgi:ornithine cyclodeaminase/alanine dehydrogenase-like protein (mu-crystallin family)